MSVDTKAEGLVLFSSRIFHYNVEPVLTYICQDLT